MDLFPYEYDDMLYRLHTTKLCEDSIKNTNLPRINVKRKNKLTIIVNFGAYSTIINRTKESISKYFYIESKLAYSINSTDQLILQGVLDEKKCENIMRNFIKQHVLCKQCRCIDTQIVKDSNLYYMICNGCGAKTSLGKHYEYN